MIRYCSLDGCTPLKRCFLCTTSVLLSEINLSNNNPSHNVSLSEENANLPENAPISPISSKLSACRTLENNPRNHNDSHIGRFYTLPSNLQKQLFLTGGITKTYADLSQTIRELVFMVRKPAIEVISYLETINLDSPAVRYVLHGEFGSGKSISLAHILHYGHSSGYILVHVPWIQYWLKFSKENSPSTFKAGRVDQPTEATQWLQHFVAQNGPLLTPLKTTKEYIWSKRETTPTNSPLTALIEHGLARPKFAADTVGAICKELKIAAQTGDCKILVALDGVNAVFWPISRVFREDKSVVPPWDLTLVQAFMRFLKNDWNHGAVVTTVDAHALPDTHRESHLPRYLIGNKGFDIMDPFLPIEVPLYSEKEFTSCLDYYIEKKWLQHPKAGTELGRLELAQLTCRNPYTVMSVVASL
nr:EOG090X05V1 [Lepidurus arcticus]